MKTFLFCSLVVVFALSSCNPKASSAASAKTETGKPAKSYVGNWDVIIEGTPMGTVNGVMTIQDEGGQLTGMMVSSGQTFKLSDTEATDGALTTSFYYPEAQTNVEIEFKGAAGSDELSGTTMGQFKTVAKRKM